MISKSKTKIMKANAPNHPDIQLEGETIETVEEFCYLGSILTPNEGPEADVRAKIRKARGVITSTKKSLWNRHEISIKTKMNVYKATVQSILLYACETWPLKAEETRSLEVFDHRCMRHILRVSRWFHISNAEVRRRCVQILSLIHISEPTRRS